MSVGFSVSFPNGDRYEYITPHITLTNAKESNTNLFPILGHSAPIIPNFDVCLHPNNLYES